jgi:Protein FAM135
VSVQKYRIKKLCDGIYEYAPVTFDEQHFCVALCTIHSCLLDFKYRSRQLKPFNRQEYMRMQEKEKQDQATKGVLIEDKNKKNQTGVRQR